MQWRDIVSQLFYVTAGYMFEQDKLKNVQVEKQEPDNNNHRGSFLAWGYGCSSVRVHEAHVADTLAIRTKIQTQSFPPQFLL